MSVVLGVFWTIVILLCTGGARLLNQCFLIEKDTLRLLNGLVWATTGVLLAVVWCLVWAHTHPIPTIHIA